MTKYNPAALADLEHQIKKMQGDKANCMLSLAKDLPPGVSLVWTKDLPTKSLVSGTRSTFIHNADNTMWAWWKCPKCAIASFSSEATPKCQFCVTLGELRPL